MQLRSRKLKKRRFLQRASPEPPFEDKLIGGKVYIHERSDNHDAVRDRIEQKVNAINQRNTGSSYRPPRKRRRYRKYRNDVTYYHRNTVHSNGHYGMNGYSHYSEESENDSDHDVVIKDLEAMKIESLYSSPSDIVPECFTGIDHPRSTKGTKGNKLFVWQWYINNKDKIEDKEFQEFVYHKMNAQLPEEQKWGEWSASNPSWKRLIEHIRRIQV